MFALTHVVHRYGRVAAATIPEWCVEKGEAWLLAGPSGCGKSTALHILAGLIVPTEGEVVVAGVDLRTLSESARDRWRGRSVGLVPQRLHLVGALRVRENLRLAQMLAGHPADEVRVTALLEAVGIADLAHRFPRELSHGQAQRVAVARAVVNRPGLVLADEPTANLDDEHADQTLGLLLAQAAEVGATLVIATHDHRVRSRISSVYALPVPLREPATADTVTG